jgi:hypothetical protein
VDADGVEHFLSEEFGELGSPVDPVHKDNDLVDGELVQQVAKLLELLSLS